MDDDPLYTKCIDTWGEEAQLDQTIEECGELIVAIRHYDRYRASFDAVLEEAADVYLMANQIGSLDKDRFNYWIDKKKQGIKERLEND